MNRRQDAMAAAAAPPPAPAPQAAPPPPQAAPPAAAAPAPDQFEQLKQLGELHAQGILTDEEFAAQKAKVLGS